MKVKETPEIAEIVFCAGVLAASSSLYQSQVARDWLERVSKWMLEIAEYSSVEEYFEKKIRE